MKFWNEMQAVVPAGSDKIMIGKASDGTACYSDISNLPFAAKADLIAGMSNNQATGFLAVTSFNPIGSLPVNSSSLYSTGSGWTLTQKTSTFTYSTPLAFSGELTVYARDVRQLYACLPDGTKTLKGSITDNITTAQLDAFLTSPDVIKTGTYVVDEFYIAFVIQGSTVQWKFDGDGKIYSRTWENQAWVAFTGGGGGTGADGTSTIFIKRTDNAASVNIYKTEAELTQLARAGFTEWDLVLSGSGYTVKVGDIIGIPYKNSTYNNKTDYVVGVVNYLDSATSATSLGFGRVNSGIDGRDGAINGVHYFETFAAASTAVNGSSFYEGKSILIAQDDWNLRIGDTDGVFRDMESFGASHTSIPANDFTPSVYNLFAAIINGYGR